MSCFENYFPRIYNTCDCRLQTNDVTGDGGLALDQIGGKFYCKKFFPGSRKTTKELSWKIVGNVAVGSFFFFGDKF